MAETTIKPLTPAELRRRRGMRQGDVAARIGVSQPTVVRLEKSHNPQLGSLDTLVEAMGGELFLLAVFPRADGRLQKFLLRTENDQRRDRPFDVLRAERSHRLATHQSAAGFKARVRGEVT